MFLSSFEFVGPIKQSTRFSYPVQAQHYNIERIVTT
jgi:hypothetical protein